MTFCTLHELIKQLQYIEDYAMRYEHVAEQFCPPGTLAPYSHDKVRVAVVEDSIIIFDDYTGEYTGFKTPVDDGGDCLQCGFHQLRKREVNEIINIHYNKQERKKRNPSLQYTYLIHDKVTGLYKIGRSKDPSARLKTLSKMQSSFVPSLTLVCEIDGDVEQFLHSQFIGKRHHGEWYLLDDKDVKFICHARFNGKFYNKYCFSQ